MVFNSRCELILRTGTGEGPWASEVCQLESDQVTFWRRRVEGRLEVQNPRPQLS